LEFAYIYDEKDVLKRVAAGDEGAFSSLFNHYRNRIYTIAFKLTDSAPLSEEILLDVFLKIWLKRERLPELEHFTAYLFTTTRNHVFNTLKQLALRRRAEDEVRVDDQLLQSRTTDYSLMDKEYQVILQQALSSLSPRQREIYALIKEQGLKREEAAALLNLSPETVKRHLAEAMYAIRVYCLTRLDLLVVILLLKRLL
jgi:RNA polymerase sigma-70 factor (family 1)